MYNIAVIFGGVTPEHSISIITALGAIKNLSLNYNPIPIYIDTKGRWFTGKNLLSAKTYEIEPSGQECFFKPNCKNLFVKRLVGCGKIEIDCALLCMHGGEYEGGAVQGMLDLAGIPYTSPNLISSSVFMDKAISKLIFSSLKIDTPRFVWGVAKDKEALIESAVKSLHFPLIVKPARCGSSVGIRMANNTGELGDAVEFAKQFDTKILIEEALTDFRELNISLLRSKNEIKFSSIEEVENGHDFYTFDDKYTQKSSAKRTVPADIPIKMHNKILKIADMLYSTFEMSGIVRFDFLAVGDKVYLNEINTIPGSFAFYLWKNEGMSFAQILNVCIKNAMLNAENEQSKVAEYNCEVLRDLDKIKAIVDK